MIIWLKRTLTLKSFGLGSLQDGVNWLNIKLKNFSFKSSGRHHFVYAFNCGNVSGALILVPAILSKADLSSKCLTKKQNSLCVSIINCEDTFTLNTFIVCFWDNSFQSLKRGGEIWILKQMSQWLSEWIGCFVVINNTKWPKGSSLWI